MRPTIWLILAFFAFLILHPPAGADEPGRMETLFSTRAGTDLRLFGRDLFTGEARDSGDAPVLGAVGDAYRLGPGDELSLLLRGQTPRSSRHRIGPDGMLLIDDLRPIAAAGRTLGEVRAEVETSVAAAHLQTQAYLSVVQVRRVGVLVLGAVAQPGRRQLPAYATALDALLAAGGVTVDGSLRAIMLIEPGGGPAQNVDLYDLLLHGEGAATRPIADGTRLVVPPLGPAVAIAGLVKRPGIYELPAGGNASQGPDDTADLMALAGGSLRPGRDQSTLLRYGPDGVERPQAVAGEAIVPLHDGDLLLYAAEGGARRGQVALAGAVEGAGERSLRPGMRLADLVNEGMMRSDLYRPLALLSRRGRAGDGTEIMALDLTALLAGRDGMEARDGDRLFLLSRTDIAYLRSRAVLSLLGGTRPLPEAAALCPGLAALAAALAADPDGPLADGPVARAAVNMNGPDLPCPPLFQTEPDLLPPLLRQSVLLRRGVLRPGPYPVAGEVPLALLAPLAGAETHETDRRVRPGQVVDVGGDGVLLTGPVRQPGLRPLHNADSLRSLLTGSGEPLAQAYGLAALLERRDHPGPADRAMLFAPADVLAGRHDQRLREGDRVTLFTRDDILALLTAPEPTTPALTEPTETAPKPVWRELLADRMVAVRGGVMRPGEYPVAGAVPLDLLLRVAGGLRADADPARVELTAAIDPAQSDSPSRLLPDGAGTDMRVEPGSAIRVGLRQRPAERRGVRLAGEVMEPGTYDIAPGETLSTLLARAGGLTPQAYPAGTIFTRASARLAEEEGLRRHARELDRQLAQMLGGKDPPDPARVALIRQLADDLRTTTGLGRISVEADPSALAARPELDIPLMGGDRVHIPKRPLTVTVAGEVLAPASLMYDPQKSARDYLREAGGLTQFADDGRIFIIHPGGAAAPLRGGWLGSGAVTVTPGALLVVPRDAEPFEWLPLAQSVTTILSQIAFGAAAIAAIQD